MWKKLFGVCSISMHLLLVMKIDFRWLVAAFLHDWSATRACPFVLLREEIDYFEGPHIRFHPYLFHVRVCINKDVS